jgi:Flp pilus assembly protein TadD
LKPDFAEAHCNLGFTFRDTGDAENAVKAFSEAIRLRPDYAKAIANLGMLHVHLGDLVSARKQCAILETVDMAQARELRAAIIAAE